MKVIVSNIIKAGGSSGACRLAQSQITASIAHPEAEASAHIQELLLKLSVHRLHFFVNAEGGWNSFDFVLVLFAYLELVAASLLNPTFLRIVRLVKVGRIARMLKALRALEDLRTTHGFQEAEDC
eukprot:s897_g15.t1